jgi:hypothetical protein
MNLAGHGLTPMVRENGVGEAIMKRERSAGRTAGTDEVVGNRKAWRAPRLTALDAQGAEFGSGLMADGPYPPS